MHGPVNLTCSGKVPPVLSGVSSEQKYIAVCWLLHIHGNFCMLYVAAWMGCLGNQLTSAAAAAARRTMVFVSRLLGWCGYYAC